MESINPARHASTPAFLYFVLAFFGAWTLRVVLLMPVDDSIHDEVVQFCWGQGLRYAIWVLPVFAFLRYVDRLSPLPFLRLNALPKRGSLNTAIPVMTAYLAATGLEGWWLQGEHPERMLAMGIFPLLWRIFLTAWAPVAEEIIFRGFLQHRLQEICPFWKANIIQSALFVAIHWPGWLYMRGFSGALIAESLGILLIALILGWLARHTGSLWPPIVLHTLNNAWRGLSG